MDLKLEVVVIPVSNVDRAKGFYEKIGFRLDVDYAAADGYRVIQFTPPGSDASIIFGKGVTSAQPGSIDRLVLAVSDIEAARKELLSHGVEVELFHDSGGGFGGGFYADPAKRAPGPDAQRRSYASYGSFRDPDGNVWLLQEIKERIPGRVSNPLDSKMTDILLEALKGAASAHGVHETELGRPDPDWPQWYAQHMAKTLVAAGYHFSGPSV